MYPLSTPFPNTIYSRCKIFMSNLRKKKKKTTSCLLSMGNPQRIKIAPDTTK